MFRFGGDFLCRHSSWTVRLLLLFVYTVGARQGIYNLFEKIPLSKQSQDANVVCDLPGFDGLDFSQKVLNFVYLASTVVASGL